jgi:phospholipase C
MKRKSSKTKLSLAVAALAILFFGDWPSSQAQSSETATPIKHLVVIFQENVSFDHYFATYPNAANPPGEPVFKAKSGTPSVNGLTGALLTNNPNWAKNPDARESLRQRLHSPSPISRKWRLILKATSYAPP